MHEDAQPQEVVRHPEVMVMADDHSGDRIIGAPLWPYRQNSVARFTPRALLESLAEGRSLNP